MNTFQHALDMAASPSAVFAAIADPQRLARWWGPDGFSNSFDVFEFQPGGNWKFTMHGPDGANYPNESSFFAIEKDRLVVVDHVNHPHFRLTITLSPSSKLAGGTLVGWTQAFQDPAVAAAVRHIVEPANDQNLRRWAAEVARTQA